MKRSKPLCIAHRGGHAGDFKKENSLAAIKNSLAQGAQAFEIDVWLVDNELIVFHDRRLSRFTNNDKKITDCTVAELKQQADTHGFEVPTLLEIMELINGQALLNIELKGPGCATAVCQLLQQRVNAGANVPKDFVVSSFDQPQLVYCLNHFPELPRGLLICGIPADLAHQAEQLRCQFLGFSLEFISQALIDDCHKKGINAWVYTVNQADDFAQLADMGVDGIFTDYPSKFIG
ncbi:glycerophosphodiester phosphodiesterase [Halioxenophilus aromaticivorans]|uniref:Glycerophosphodiester phosphodiesterase n=1 Tax=Halioxenophilus aromaticivorans TaxID=1306992 RepID=A0AAV3U0Z5_9ALTE